MSPGTAKKTVNRILILALSVSMIILLLSYRYQENKITGIRSDLSAYLSEAYRIERRFIENISIYRDYATPAREQELRKYLLKEHIKAAEKYGIRPVVDDAGIKAGTDRKMLVNVDRKGEKLYYFHNVRKRYRFLTSGAYRGLIMLTEKFQENLNRRVSLPEVKIAISSAIRPVSYQKKLRGRNMNASFVSTHSYGTSFDIFFDDYFVSLPLKEVSSDISGEVLSRLKTRLGYMMGDSLRRQLRSILMETLLQLQDEGKLFAILEKKQRCYHVTILEK